MTSLSKKQKLKREPYRNPVDTDPYAPWWGVESRQNAAVKIFWTVLAVGACVYTVFFLLPSNPANPAAANRRAPQTEAVTSLPCPNCGGTLDPDQQAGELCTDCNQAG